MRIGIISDIHAQYDALEKALTLLEQQQVDCIVCAGDLVEKGQDGDRVIQEIIRRKIPCVRGNHDEAAVSNQRWLRKNLASSNVQDIIERLNRDEFLKTPLLSDRAIVYLQALPFSREWTWEGVKVQLFHGSPLSNSQYLMPALPDKMLNEFLELADGEIIICGHTHSPMHRQLGRRLLINSGSVCYSPHNRDSHSVGILTLPEKNFEVYDLQTGRLCNID